MHTGKLSRWLGLGLILDISIMVWRFWWVTDHLIALLPYRTVTDWTRDPDLWIWVIFYGAGFVGILMAVTGDRRPLLFWNVCYLVLLVPAWIRFPMSMDILLRYPSNLEYPIRIFAVVIATIAIYIGHRQMRMEHRSCEATLSNGPINRHGPWELHSAIDSWSSSVPKNGNNFLSPALRSSANEIRVRV
jgi:hypothetical protein